jgi:hypothetical protein
MTQKEGGTVRIVGRTRWLSRQAAASVPMTSSRSSVWAAWARSTRPAFRGWIPTSRLWLLPAELASRAEMVQRFQREARAVVAVNHPSIVTIHSVEQDDDVHS